MYMKKVSKYKLLVLVAAAFTMQSCLATKNYKSPEVETENLYRTEVELDSTTLADVPWQELFTDSYLQSYIEQGLESNYDLQIAIQNLEAATAQMKQGKAEYYPVINANGSWVRQETSENGTYGGGTIEQFQLGAAATWELDIWGKLNSSKKAAMASYLQSAAARQAVQTQIISAISSTYYQLLALDAQVLVAEENLKNRILGVEVIKSLKESGDVNEMAVKQTEAQKLGTQIILEDLKYNVKVLENTLSILIGKAPATLERGTFDEQEIAVDIKPGLPALLLSKRPDVVSAEMNFRRTFELTNVARSKFYPSIKLSAEGGLQSLDFSNLFSDKSLFGNLSAGLTQPIFNRRAIKTEYEVSQANQQKAYLQYQKALLTAGKEVSDALADYENESNKLAVRTEQLNALKVASEYSEQLLEYGRVNYLEVLTVKDNVLNSELQLISNKFNQLNAVITLYRSLGGGV